jgi:hypothetical protein
LVAQRISPGQSEILLLRQSGGNNFYYSIDDFRQNLSAVIYPNPATSSFIISFASHEAESQISIFNIVGQLLYSAIARNDLQINCAGFSPGIYYVNLKSANASLTQKLIIGK